MDKRAYSGKYTALLGHAPTMTAREWAEHYGVSMACIYVAAKNMGVTLRKGCRPDSQRFAIPIGKMSGPRPTATDLREMAEAEPRIDPGLLVFLV